MSASRRWAAAAATAALLAAGPLAPGSAGAQEREEVEITVTHVSGNVHVLEGRGGNIGVSLGEDGVLLVDDQYAPLAPRVRSAVESLGGGAPDWVLNTHWHHDHTDGNREFGREAPILSHHNVRRRLAEPQAVRGDTTPALPDRALPDVTFGEGVTVHLNGEEVRVRHLPRGHTDGDAVVFFTGSDVVHMGDHMFAGQFPFVDLATGGSVQGYTRNVASVLDTLPADARVIPGHGGPVTDVEGLEEYHRMLTRTTEIVRDRMEEGMTLDEVVDAGLPERWASWGEGFISTEQWLETVYRSLDREGERSAGAGGRDATGAWHPHGHDGRGPGAHADGGGHHHEGRDAHGHGGHERRDGDHARGDGGAEDHERSGGGDRRGGGR